MQTLEKKIKSPSDMHHWEKSLAYQEYLRFLLTVNDAIESKKISKAPPPSEAVRAINNLLDQLQAQTSNFPPDTTAAQNPGRFGYPAFRDWFSWVCNESLGLIRSLLAPYQDKSTSETTGETKVQQDKDSKSMVLELNVDPGEISREDVEHELSDYLCESFGNSTRIDYGTGHEMAFLAFLACLFKVGFLGRYANPEKLLAFQMDLQSTALTILPRYLSLVRHLQTLYRMEPAGSHGVWCLDDYQFIPFFWGSSQLIGEREITPSHISDPLVFPRYAEDYLFFSCLEYISQVKSGPFHEHSPTLYGISGVPTWEKVNSGMVKMYKGEVLAKFPVVQHFGFGKLLPFVPASQYHSAGTPAPKKLVL